MYKRKKLGDTPTNNGANKIEKDELLTMLKRYRTISTKSSKWKISTILW